MPRQAAEARSAQRALELGEHSARQERAALQAQLGAMAAALQEMKAQAAKVRAVLGWR